jgi:hypothetical protein
MSQTVNAYALRVTAEKPSESRKNNFFWKKSEKKSKNEKPKIKKRKIKKRFFCLAGGRGGKNHPEIEKCKPTRNLRVDFAKFSP